MKIANDIIRLSVVLLVVGGSAVESTTISDAQASIDKQIETAVSSGVDGLALSLNYVLAPGFQGPAVALRIPGASTDQQCLVDTGSSSISFCDGSLAAGVESYKTNMAQGNLYGNLIQCTGGTENADGSTDWSTSTCAVVAQPTNASTCYGFYEFYYGSVYQGDVGVYDTDQLVYTMSNVSYAVMEQQQNMTCTLGFDGIFGVAFSGLNTASVLPANATASDLINFQCEGVPNYNNLVTNPVVSFAQSDLPSPVQQALAGSGTVDEVFGIHFAYDAAMSAQPGTTEGLGAVYAGAMATDNELYRGGTPLTAVFPQFDPTNLEDEFYWSIAVKSISLAGTTLQTYDDSFCGAQGSNCYVDSGTPLLEIPLDNCDVIRPDETLQITLVGVQNTEVTLKLPTNFLIDQYARGWATCSGSTGSLVLGFPIFAHYYVAFNMSSGAITFVDLPQTTTPPATSSGPNVTTTATTAGPTSGCGDTKSETVAFLAMVAFMSLFCVMF